jgi:hypothetical protein
MKKALLLTIAALFTVVASNAVFAKTEKETTDAATAAPAEATETVKPADAATAAPAEATETVKPADAATAAPAEATEPAEAATEKPADETAKPEKK